MNLLRARSWGQVKPPPGSQIDWGHSLAHGLVFCALLNEPSGRPIDLVSGQQSRTATAVDSRQRLARSSWGSSTASSSDALWTGYVGPAARAASQGVTVAASIFVNATNYGTAFKRVF